MGRYDEPQSIASEAPARQPARGFVGADDTEVHITPSNQRLAGLAAGTPHDELHRSRPLLEINEHARQKLGRDRPRARDDDALFELGDVRAQVPCRGDEARGAVGEPGTGRRRLHVDAATFEERAAEPLRERVNTATKHAAIDPELLRGSLEGSRSLALYMREEGNERLQVEKQVTGIRWHDAYYASSRRKHGIACLIRIPHDRSMGVTVLVVLVVVPHEGKYLIVEECDGTFFLPAGRVEPGESLIDAAIRETAEEAGVRIGLRGLLGFDHSDRRMRFTFVGHPATLGAPKREPDRHSRGAAWFTKAEIQKLPLRHHEVLTWIERHERSTALLPCAAYVHG